MPFLLRAPPFVIQTASLLSLGSVPFSCSGCRSSPSKYISAQPLNNFSFLPLLRARCRKGKRDSDELTDKDASIKKEKKEVEQLVLNEEKFLKLKKTSIDPLGQKEEENQNLDFGKVDSPLSVPKMKKIKKGKRSSDESPDKDASSKKENKEEQLVLNKENVLKLKKTSIDPLGQKEENRNLDFENVGSPPLPVPETKKIKKGKRDSDESPDKDWSSKKEKKEEQVVLNEEKVLKLKKTSIDPLGQMEEENRNLDFEKVTEAPIIALPTKGDKKGKRGGENVPEKQARSKKQKIEAESNSQSNKKAKKMKRALVEPMKEEDECISSDFDEEPKTPANKFELSDTKRLFVGNLSADVIMDDLFEFFKEAGEVIEVQLAAKKDGSFLGFGHVKFLTGTDAQRALGMNGKLFLGRRLMANLELESKGAQECGHFTYVKSLGKSLEDQPKAPAKLNEKTGTKRLFVGNLPPELIKDDLLELFKKAGEVVEVQLAAKEDGSFRGFGHVMFATGADADRALEMNGQMFLGRRLIVDLAHGRGSTDPSERKGAKDSSHWVFVKGFGKVLEEDQIRNLLKEHFGSCGEIIRVAIPQDNKTGHSKGFAFVLFNDHATVSKALELNGTELGKYTLTVKKSTPKSGIDDGASRGGRGTKGRSGDQGGGRGEDGKGHGMGRKVPGGPYDKSVTTASKAKKTTFDDAD